MISGFSSKDCLTFNQRLALLLVLAVPATALGRHRAFADMTLIDGTGTVAQPQMTAVIANGRINVCQPPRIFTRTPTRVRSSGLARCWPKQFLPTNDQQPLVAVHQADKGFEECLLSQ